ncbi:hypothetical protein Pst134EA_022920 [Puccinia striiformis f. sp. tritici]|uniref:hypothetical protein n=1 Tax=Puccinia striiformis f. sp. tritici TaxID=168172 RepID=UPI0020078C23|nr:hypothetical protein Pst134EA_022920 [Puccinia striiformis f. sp. tritici]KAH9455457.1 hypothetical protein Pst134EA_022920 [Puccinia striiformis f. sp. tritici]
MVSLRSSGKISNQPARGQSAPTRKRVTSTTRGQGRVQTNGGNQQLNEEEEEEDEEEEEEEEPVGFTLDNFEAHLTSWTEPSLRQALANRKKNSNRIPPEVLEVLNYYKLNYRKIKLMLALIGRVSEKTINASLGEDKPTRKKCGWNRFQAFSVKSAETPVPPRGSSVGWDERNTTLGDAWRALATNQKEVFDARIFAYFSKLPIHFNFEHDDKEPDEDGSPSTDENQTKDLLTPAEKALYEPLYEDLVNHEKVKLVSGGELGRESNTGSQALKHIDRINSELFTICNAYNLTFYLLSATRHPGTGSFCRESTNDPYWLPVAKDRWKSKETFEAYSHGRAVQEVVEECSGLHPPPEKKQKTLRPVDGLRSKLRKVLNKLLGSALGVEEAQFPKGADPISLMAERFPEKKFPNLKIIRSEECQLAAEIFALGFEAMHNPHRVQWLADIENGHFKITNTAEP